MGMIKEHLISIKNKLVQLSGAGALLKRMPYGIQGIGNNIVPLVESFARLKKEAESKNSNSEPLKEKHNKLRAEWLEVYGTYDGFEEWFSSRGATIREITKSKIGK